MSNKDTYIEIILNLAIDNKYTKWYIQLIQKAANRKLNGYTETHHIVPDCLFINRSRKGSPGFIIGTPNNKNNLVILSPEEHFIAHLLLLKMFNRSFQKYHSLVYAIKMMTISPNGSRVNNKLYGWTKKLISETISENITGKNNPFYGKLHTQTAIQKMKDNKLGDNNPCFGKIWITNGIENKRVLPNTILKEGWCKGRTLSKTHIKKSAKSSIFGKQFLSIIETKKTFDKGNASKMFPELKIYF